MEITVHMRLQGIKKNIYIIFNKNRKIKLYNIDKNVKKMYFQAT